jgi:hypothetical protein
VRREATDNRKKEVAMAHTFAERRSRPGPSLWFYAFVTIILASGSLFIVMWSPKALALALIVGAGALASRALFQRVKVDAHAQAEGSSTVANAGLALATVAIAPLLAFALLWTALLVFLGVTWVLNAVGII